MGFDIRLKWEAPVERERSLAVAHTLAQRFPELREHELDAEVIAEVIGVPASEVWDHWQHAELVAEPEGPIIHLDRDGATLEVPVRPALSTAEALTPALRYVSVLEAQGLALDKPVFALRSEYEAHAAAVAGVLEITASGSGAQEAS
jgi:hypothetical protein